VYFFYFIAYKNNRINYFKADRKAISLPVASEYVDKFELNCPAIFSTVDYLQCDIKLNKGINLNVAINYGDGSTAQTFSPLGMFYKK
jgi:hypothetical protein